jgi:hypothetical protein
LGKPGRKPSGRTFRINTGLMFAEVGEALHRRAQETGQTMTDYLAELIARDAGAASVAELRERDKLVLSA